MNENSQKTNNLLHLIVRELRVANLLQAMDMAKKDAKFQEHANSILTGAYEEVIRDEKNDPNLSRC